MTGLVTGLVAGLVTGLVTDPAPIPPPAPRGARGATLVVERIEGVRFEGEGANLQAGFAIRAGSIHRNVSISRNERGCAK